MGWTKGSQNYAEKFMFEKKVHVHKILLDLCKFFFLDMHFFKLINFFG